MPDICVATCSKWDIMCLDMLLYSLSRFADLPSLNVFVSNNSGGTTLAGMLERTCLKYDMMSLHIDSFRTSEPSGNLQHGEMLNRLIPKTTSEHIVLLDPDIIITSSRWRPWCESHMDSKFLVGTPYRYPERFWVGDVPNSWCTFVDGDILRCSNLDMRPKVRYHPRKGRWILSGRKPKDCSWRLGLHTKSRGLGYISFPVAGTDEMLMWMAKRICRLRGSKTRRHIRNVLGHLVLNDLGMLRPTGYRLPGSKSSRQTCCIHLKGHRIRPRTLQKWVSCGKNVVDVYYEVDQLDNHRLT